GLQLLSSRSLRGPPPRCCLRLWYAHHRDLHSFPTRRSSDLGAFGEEGVGGVQVERAAGNADGTVGADPDVVTDRDGRRPARIERSEEHTSELQSRENLVCRLLLEKKKRGSHAQHAHARCSGG